MLFAEQNQEDFAQLNAGADGSCSAFVRSNVNPNSGFVTNYLNHYVELFLLFDMLPQFPEFADEIKTWKPMAYVDHVRQSGLKDVDIILEFYEKSDPARKAELNQAIAEADAKVASLVERMCAQLDHDRGIGLVDFCTEAKETGEHLVSRINCVIQADQK